jgi:hypothetical protein
VALRPEPERRALMRIRSAAALAVTAGCACAGGPALAAVAGQGSSPAAVTQTSPLTRPLSTTTTTATNTTTNPTQTTTTPAKPQDVCLTKARRAIARSLGVGVKRVSVAIGEGNNGMPQCTYVIRRARAESIPHTHVHLVVNVDSAPQASWRLMRTVVEAGQLFGPAPPGWHAPLGLYGLGQYASWFIKLRSLMCVNHTRTQLLTVTVSWKHADRGQMIKLARETVEPYIHAPANAVPIPISQI